MAPSLAKRPLHHDLTPPRTLVTHEIVRQCLDVTKVLEGYHIVPFLGLQETSILAAG